MTPQPPNPRSIFGRAVELESAAERKAYLDEACAGAPEVRERVEALLRAHAAAGGFLQPAATGPAVTADYTPSPEPPNRVGPYKLLEKIGEGGMGEVWVADQLEPIKRRVALKLIKPGMDSRGVLARFEAERQALAVMDHPNIARVLDAGTTDDGRPYFVMELVKGTPITQFCDARKLTPRERLELFVPVCQAIQHAHMKGIIHRDIKPSNVLVALHDEKPVPKVIDFGVAKAVGQQLTEKTIYTGFGALVGTPAYMAPEQATFNQLDIDTRSDVYSLGVLLYELLAGSPPVEPERLKKAALDEVLRLVREEEPPRPSHRLSTSQARASIAATRGSEPAKLSALMKGELDWIVMKALEKDRSRRYDTASNFAADVQRYLAGEQVQAVPPSLGYRLKKAYRRNRTAVLVGGLIAAVLFAATGVSVAFGVMAKRAEGVAEDRRQEAAENAERADANAHRAQTNEERAVQEAAKLRVEQDRTRRLLYASRLNAAGIAYIDGRVDRLTEHLAASTPEPGQPDLRGWEWHHLSRAINPERVVNLFEGSTPERATGAGANAYSANGLFVAYSRHVDGGSVYEVWETLTGRRVGRVPQTGVLPLRVFPNTENEFIRADLSPEGRFLMVNWLPQPTRKRSNPQAKQEVLPSPVSQLWDATTGEKIPVPEEVAKNGQANSPSFVLGPGAVWAGWVHFDRSRVIESAVLNVPIDVTVYRWDRSTGTVAPMSPAFKIGTGFGRPTLLADGQTVVWTYRPDPQLSPVVPLPTTDGVASLECWEVAAGKARSRFEPITYPVPAVKRHDRSQMLTGLSTTGSMCAIQTADEVRVYQLKDGPGSKAGQLMWKAPVPENLKEYIAGPGNLALNSALYVSDDGARIVFRVPDLLLILEPTPNSGVSTRRISFADRTSRLSVPVVGSRILPDGKTFVNHEGGKRIARLWDVSRDPALTPTGNQVDPQVVRKTEDGKLTIYQVTSPNGRIRVEYPEHTRQPDPRTEKPLLAGMVVVRDGAGKTLREIPLPSGCGRVIPAFLHDGRRLLLTFATYEGWSQDGTLMGYTPTYDWQMFTLDNGVQDGPKGTGTAEKVPGLPLLVASGSRAGSRGVSESTTILTESGETRCRIEMPGRSCSILAFDSTGRRFLVRSIPRPSMPSEPAAPGVVRGPRPVGVRYHLYETATGQSLWSRDIDSESLIFDSVAVTFSPDDSLIFVHTHDEMFGSREDQRERHLHVLQTSDGTPTRSLKTRTTLAGFRMVVPFSRPNLTFAPDGKHVAVGSGSEVIVWDFTTGEIRHRLPGHEGNGGDIAMAFSADGSRLFTRDREETGLSPFATRRIRGTIRIHVWDLSIGRELLTLAGELPSHMPVTPQLTFEGNRLILRGLTHTRVYDGAPFSEPKK